MIKKIFILIFPILFLCNPAYAFRANGMKTPESFQIDPATGIYYVSNIDGHPKAKDNNGVIAKLDPSGKPIDLHFIRGGKDGVTLHAPKGMVIVAESIYVTDIDTVRRFDKKTGKLLGTVDLSLLGARFLNDLATSPEGILYVSDTNGNAIYRIDPEKNFQVTLAVKDSRLGNPNGMVYDTPRKRLIVVASGTGNILGVDLKGNIFPLVPKKFHHLDGIDFDREGNIIVSNFTKGEIYRIKGFNKVEVIKKNMVTPADISFDSRNNQLLIPSFKGNLVFTHPMD